MATKTSVNPVPGASVTPPPRRSRRAIDIALSVVFLALQMVFGLGNLPISFITGMFAGDGGGSPYHALGSFLYIAGPAVVFIISLGVDLFLLVTKRRTWVIALVGLIASVVIWLLGATLVG
jgi:hypothetical protein